MNKTPEISKIRLPAAVRDKVERGIPLRKAIASTGIGGTKVRNI